MSGAGTRRPAAPAAALMVGRGLEGIPAIAPFGATPAPARRDRLLRGPRDRPGGSRCGDAPGRRRLRRPRRRHPAGRRSFPDFRRPLQVNAAQCGVRRNDPRGNVS